MARKPTGPLRRGWTTGACATAAVKAALLRLRDGTWGDTVSITLPKGETPVFALETTAVGEGWAEAGIIKDAGDDPDVTHGALIKARVELGGNGVSFHAGEGVGHVTKAGLPIAVGEPAINPVPRAMMDEVVAEIGWRTDVRITISVPDGAAIAQKTWNPRLGIVGGISILGTTGVVRPFSCAAWIASIHRGIDVAVAEGMPHVAGCTGATSEKVVQQLYGLPDHGMLDMGDFSGGLLKYLAKTNVPHITIGGGIGKLVKLAQGAVDLHSGRSQVDFNSLSQAIDNESIKGANTALEAYEIAGPAVAEWAAETAQVQIQKQLRGSGITSDVVLIDRAGKILARAGDRP
ncbi:cobalt-precorrin-5B (C(1))-methyltransferase [Nereida sp. NH-UV-3]|uniref:cobalt-precorrin-5B (C(1))-methyltransferase n=1 Tax=Nereida TaxID=282198 RepID=UPI0036F346D4